MRQPLRCSLGLIVVMVCAVAGAAPARAANVTTAVSASVVKPLTLSWLRDLDFGTIVLGPGSWTGATIALSRTGAFSCSDPNVTCSGATQTAMYNTTGTNNMRVYITAPNVTLTNQADPSRTLLLTVDNPGSVVLTSSGVPGVDFSIGGSIAVDSDTAGGLYTGTFNVTVNY